MASFERITNAATAVITSDAISDAQEDFKTHELPLARIKKIMRLEDDVAELGAPRFMIAAEAPIVIAKACEIFVLEVILWSVSIDPFATQSGKHRVVCPNLQLYGKRVCS